MIQAFRKMSILFSLVLFVTTALILAQDVIQTQESDTWDGIEVDLTSLKVKNNIVTVRFKLRNEGSEKQVVMIRFDSCYIVDESNQKKYYALKDADGIFIGGPLYDKNDGGRFWYDINPGKSKSLWIKFPEPTDNPETMTISIPGVFPFEDVELKK